LSKPGHERDSSYEVSNLLVFDPNFPRDEEADTCNIEKMVFSQPANVTGAPLTFNVISVKGGSLVFAVSWQIGAFGVAEEDERDFVTRLCLSVYEGFRDLSSEPGDSRKTHVDL